MDSRIIIGKNIIHLLELRGMTQRELAESLGVNKSVVSAWCLGQKSPRTTRLDDIAKVLSCAVEDILRDPETTPDFRQSMKDDNGVIFDLFEKATPEQKHTIEKIIKSIVSDE